MPVLIVWLTSWLTFLAMGAAGVHAFAAWRDSARYTLAVMFMFTATAHFNRMKHDLARMRTTPHHPAGAAEKLNCGLDVFRSGNDFSCLALR
jgi:hypothetical protein